MRSASRSLALWLSLFLFWGLVFWGVWQLLTNPDAGLPREWNPLEPLHISDPVTPVTGLKLRRTANNGPACLSALETGSVTFQSGLQRLWGRITTHSMRIISTFNRAVGEPVIRFFACLFLI